MKTNPKKIPKDLLESIRFTEKAHAKWGHRIFWWWFYQKAVKKRIEYYHQMTEEWRQPI